MRQNGVELHGHRLCADVRFATHVTGRVSPLAVDRFARVMRERLTTGAVPFRKAYIGSLVDRIEVDDAQVRIMGRKEVLEQAVRSSETTSAVVHAFVPNWRSRQDETVNTYVLAVPI